MELLVYRINVVIYFRNRNELHTRNIIRSPINYNDTSVNKVAIAKF